MAVINKEELLDTLKEGLALHATEPTKYLEKMLKYTVIEVSKKFSSLFYNELTLTSDSSGIITLPSDTFKLISAQYYTVEVQPLTLRQKNIYDNLPIVTSSNLWGCIKQFKDRVELRITPEQVYTDMYVLIQNLNGGCGNIPVEYEEVLFWGTRYRYLSSKRGQIDDKIISKAGQIYQVFLDRLTMEQGKMQPSGRMQQYWEHAWESNISAFPADQTADVYY